MTWEIAFVVFSYPSCDITQIQRVSHIELPWHRSFVLQIRKRLVTAQHWDENKRVYWGEEETSYNHEFVQCTAWIFCIFAARNQVCILCEIFQNSYAKNQNVTRKTIRIWTRDALLPSTKSLSVQKDPEVRPPVNSRSTQGIVISKERNSQRQNSPFERTNTNYIVLLSSFYAWFSSKWIKLISK